MEKLGGISYADAVTVGDTRFDIEAAGKACLETIAFLCGGTSELVLREAGAIAIYRDPADFLAHYDELATLNVKLHQAPRVQRPNRPWRSNQCCLGNRTVGGCNRKGFGARIS